MFPMMNCDQVTKAADDFLERRLNWRRRLAVLAHIAMCKGCKTYIEQLRLTLLSLRALPRPAATPPSDNLMTQFHGQTRKPQE